MSDQENQEDELCVLQSIYTDEEFSIGKNGELKNGQFIAYIKVPEGFFVTYKNLEDENMVKIPITYLPPIILKFTLPMDYPSKSMPHFEISCLWLTVKKLNMLCKRLDELWNENNGTVILYTWTQFLKEESLEYLGILQSLDLTRRYVAELRRFRFRNKYRPKDNSSLSSVVNDKDNNERSTASQEVVVAASAELPVFNKYNSKNVHPQRQNFAQLCNNDKRSNNLPEDDLSSSRRRYYPNNYHRRPHLQSYYNSDRSSNALPPQQFFKDPRIVFQSMPSIHTHQYITAFNEDRTKLQFLRNIHLCEICFLDKTGDKCIEFHPCNHVYCKDCIKEYFETRINEGMVQTMPCPCDSCNSEASQQQIKEVIGKTLFDKYDDLLFSFTLNAMEDITYCPRQSCGTPVMREPDEKLAVCTSCRFTFCVFCKMTYHGVEPCKLKSEEKRKIVEEYEQGDSDIRFRLEKRYGKKQLELMVQYYRSENWISTNSKACPQCGANIEKSDGCNKMVCGQCKEYFCWLCLKVLDQNDPYDHFWDPSSKCNNQLFHGTQLTAHNGADNVPALDLLAGLEEELEMLDEDDQDFFVFDFGNNREPIRFREDGLLYRIVFEQVGAGIAGNPNDMVFLL